MPAEQLLVVLPSWVGDVVMATPALRAIRARFADARITYLQRPYIGELLAGCDWFDAVEHWPLGKYSPAGHARLIRRLRRRSIDTAILFPNAFRAAALMRLAGARRRIGYARDGRGWLLTDRLAPKRNGRKFAPVPMLDYYRALAEAAGCSVNDDRLELRATPDDEATLDKRLGADDARPLLVLNPGAAFGPAKCWPAERYATLADRLSTDHGLRTVVSCGPKERAVADAVRAAARVPLTVFAEPPLGLGPLKALVRRARLMITNDTGPRHFAAAFGTPVVTIFGSSDPSWTDTRHPLERKVMTSLDCQPCMQRVCPLGHHRCMTDLTVDIAAEAAEALLAAAADRVTPAASSR
ncbi:MAG: lipopolysaccharide heptosyltransferase II [Phycisphaerae bacterium]